MHWRPYLLCEYFLYSCTLPQICDDPYGMVSTVLILFDIGYGYIGYATPSLHNYYMEPWVSDPTDNIAVSASKTLALFSVPHLGCSSNDSLMRMNFIIIRRWLHIISVCLLIELQLLMLRLYSWNHYLCACVVSGEWQTWSQCVYLSSNRVCHLELLQLAT